MKKSMIRLFVVVSTYFAHVALAEDAADLILVNGRVYTVEQSQPWAEALAIKGEWLLAVSTNAEARAFSDPDTREIDLDVAFVSPEFNDSHVHVESTGRLLSGVNLLDVHEPAAFQERFQATAERIRRRERRQAPRSRQTAS